ncbi:hypothetical protein CERSUDRAFT_101338 [Gelatoporia subvermispora B]|uniref:Ubiquitin-like domain-containing protein n=1 Tax=Ceriporiopsis subvermispora (strain B) TaxID=914234 RepID=M2QX13_CERS8|nr:hypothetical protein CERSUDRAFT_101338 [Gelatoporia subvermispora B]
MVLASIHNLPKRIKSAHLREVRRAPGKENIPPGMKPIAARPSPPSFLPYVDQGAQEDPAARWLPKDGQIIIKVAVPATDDLWKLRVPEDVTLAAFVRRVEAKVGFVVAFQAVGVGAARCMKITTEGAFQSWVRRLWGSSALSRSRVCSLRSDIMFPVTLHVILVSSAAKLSCYLPVYSNLMPCGCPMQFGRVQSITTRNDARYRLVSWTRRYLRFVLALIGVAFTESSHTEGCSTPRTV